MQRRAVLVVFAGGGLGEARGADPGARITLLDGQAVVHAGAKALRAAEGLPLGAGALVDTDAKCPLLRIEWPDGSALDLGPGTRLMLSPPTLPRVPAGAAFYLLQGFAKFSAAAPGHAWATPLVAAAPAVGTATMSIDERGDMVLFAERGAWPLTERAPGTAGSAAALPAGSALRLAPGRSVERLTHAPADWLPTLPRAFRDTLPLRLPAVQKRAAPVPEPLPPASYAELKPWLTAEAALRREFPQRFGSRIAEREFRTAVAANLRQHPEWQPVLEPPKPRVPKAPASRAPA